MIISPTNVEAVKTAVGSLIAAQLTDAQIERWLLTAEMKIRSRFRTLDTLIEKGTIEAADVARVCELAAERVARNPDGFRQFGIDNGNGTRDQVLSDGQVKIMDDEWAIIAPQAQVAIQGGYAVTFGTPC